MDRLNIQQQNQNIPSLIESPVATTINFLPNLVGAMIILFIGWMFGRVVGSIVGRITSRTGLDRSLRSTPLGRVFGEADQDVSSVFNILARWFIYGIAFLAAANVLAIPALSQWIIIALTYLPALIAGILIIIFGFILADFVGDMIDRNRMTRRTSRYKTWLADATRILLYFVVVVIGLDTMGIDVTILYILAIALAGGLAIGVAIAIGIGFGMGMKDYINNHMDEWARKTKDEVENRES